MTNVIFSIVLATNTTELPHPSGMEMERVVTVTEWHVATHINGAHRCVMSNANSVTEQKTRLVREWKERPLDPERLPKPQRRP